MTTFTPQTADELRDAVAWAVSEEAPVEILGHGTKRGIGRPLQTEHAIDLSQLSGVTLYEPEELVLSAKAGTPVAEIVWKIGITEQTFYSWMRKFGGLGVAEVRRLKQLVADLSLDKSMLLDVLSQKL